MKNKILSVKILNKKCGYCGEVSGPVSGHLLLFSICPRRHTSAAARSGNSPNFNTLTLDIFPPIMHSALPILSVNTYRENQFTKLVSHFLRKTFQRIQWRHYFQYCFHFINNHFSIFKFGAVL